MSLTVPISDDSYILHTDASGEDIGACLHVCRKDEELPVGFFSRQLKPAERNYSVTELESLAIVAVLKYFEFYIYAKEVRVVTDHKPCLALLNGSTLNKRLLRFALTLQLYPIVLVHRAGVNHANADGMSRQNWSNCDYRPTVATVGDQIVSPEPILGGGDVGVPTRGETRAE